MELLKNILAYLEYGTQAINAIAKGINVTIQHFPTNSPFKRTQENERNKNDKSQQV